MTKLITRQRLIDDLHNLGVKKGDTINVKASLASIGMVDGGAIELVEALISTVGEEGTIITDSFIDCYELPLNRKNKENISNDASSSYAGALANAMINHPMSVRSKHPIQKFAHLCATRWLGPTDKIFQILSRRIIDRSWFPAVNRPGFQVCRPDSHWFLEQFIPFL